MANILTVTAMILVPGLLWTNHFGWFTGGKNRGDVG